MLDDVVGRIVEDSGESGSRQAELSVVLWKEKSVSKEWVFGVETDQERPKRIDDFLCRTSERYRGLTGQVKGKRIDQCDQREALALEGRRKALKAVRLMFRRALHVVYFLKQGKCKEVRAVEQGLAFEMEGVFFMESANSVARAGKTILEAEKKKQGLKDDLSEYLGGADPQTEELVRAEYLDYLLNYFEDGEANEVERDIVRQIAAKVG